VRVLPEGLAYHYPKNADLVVQTHFHPTGKAEEEATTDCGKTDEAEPSPAEQTYLAALLYVRPIPVDPPKPQTAEPEVSAPGRDAAPPSEPNEETTSSTAPNRSEPAQNHVVAQRPEVACPVSQRHSAEVAAPISTPPSTQNPGPVNSASTPVRLPAVQSAVLKSVSPANPDESLIPRDNATVKKARGTSGAKAVRDMINLSANQANSNPEPHAMRSAAASLTASAMGLDKDMPGYAQGDAQDQTLNARSEINRSLSESFSARISRLLSS